MGSNKPRAARPAAVPEKTDEGLRELAQRARGLSQRHRTMLLLVDGRRDVDQVLSMGQAAGVSPSVFAELVELGMIAEQVNEPVDSELLNPSHFTASFMDTRPLEDAAHTSTDTAADGPAENSLNSSILPASRSLLPDSAWDKLTPASAESRSDWPLAEARDLLIRAVRAEAPVAGSLTLLKLKRIRTRDELEALLDEVQGRLSKPHRTLKAMQTMQNVRHLLSLPEPGNDQDAHES